KIMEFPRDNKDLDQLFLKAGKAHSRDIHGEYYVDMLTVIPSLRRFDHRKTFIHNKDRVTGYNILFSKTKWGYFFLERGKCKKFKDLDVLVINYDQKKNRFFLKQIRDQIRCIKKGRLYLGRFHYLLSGKLIFLGYFSMIKK
ncbi:MAG: hypothetical protein JW827_00980, partial [Spirochaetes bacterium]|nr:hypothetical protein [Spirochaetota bacterium]